MEALLSLKSKMFLGECRNQALRCGNDYLSLQHFVLAFRESEAGTASSRISAEAATKLEESVRDHRLGQERAGMLPFSRSFEEVLKYSARHRRITGNTAIEPEDIYLSFLAHRLGNYPLYVKYLREKAIVPPSWKYPWIRLLCSPLFRIKP